MAMGRGGFSEEDRKKLDSVFNKVNNVDSTMEVFKTVLIKAVDIIDSQAQQIRLLNKELNLANYRTDALNQYGRKESWRADGLDPAIHGSDPIKIVEDIVKEIEEKARDKDGNKVKIGMSTEHIQRCHFLGDKKRGSFVNLYLTASG